MGFYGKRTQEVRRDNGWVRLRYKNHLDNNWYCLGNLSQDESLLNNRESWFCALLAKGNSMFISKNIGQINLILTQMR